MADALVFVAIHKTAQRREASAQQKLEIANLPAGQVPGGKILGARLEYGAVFVVEFKVNQFAAMRSNKMTVRFCRVDIHLKSASILLSAGGRNQDRSSDKESTLTTRVACQNWYFTVRYGKDTGNGLRFQDRRERNFHPFRCGVELGQEEFALADADGVGVLCHW